MFHSAERLKQFFKVAESDLDKKLEQPGGSRIRATSSNVPLLKSTSKNSLHNSRQETSAETGPFDQVRFG
jgi:hypothetical protein